jgi:hypothetical protein
VTRTKIAASYLSGLIYGKNKLEPAISEVLNGKWQHSSMTFSAQNCSHYVISIKLWSHCWEFSSFSNVLFLNLWEQITPTYTCIMALCASLSFNYRLRNFRKHRIYRNIYIYVQAYVRTVVGRTHSGQCPFTWILYIAVDMQLYMFPASILFYGCWNPKQIILILYRTYCRSSLKEEGKVIYNES